jgi:hypothetical protein
MGVLLQFRVGSDGPGNRQEVLAGVSRELWPPAAEGFEGVVRELSFQMERLRMASETQTEATSENTAAIVQNTLAQGSRGESGVAKVGGTLARVFGSALGLSPLISGLLGLFKRDEPEAPRPLVKYISPPPVHVEGWMRRGIEEDEWSELASRPDWGTWPGVKSDRETRTAPIEVTVQVQAIDSRSFLDHSWEIAQAVREAMLQSHALNDVVNEL